MIGILADRAQTSCATALTFTEPTIVYSLVMSIEGVKTKSNQLLLLYILILDFKCKYNFNVFFVSVIL